MLKKNFLANFQRITLELFTQRIATKHSRIRDLEKPIPDPVVKKAPDPGSGSATLILPGG
jgi:hypothetical protein